MKAVIHVILLLAERDFAQRITWIPVYAGITNFAQNLTFDGGTNYNNNLINFSPIKKESILNKIVKPAYINAG